MALNCYTNFHQILAKNAAQFPDRIYVHCIDQNKSLTYGTLYGLSNRISHFLKTHKIKANDRILLLAENSVENLAVFVSVLRYGASIATVHVEMNQGSLIEIIKAIDPKIILYQSGLGLEELKQKAPGIWLLLGEFKGEKNSTGFFSEVYNFTDKDDLSSCAEPDDHGVIFYTSGTVAKPKGVIQTHANAFYNYDATADYLQLSPGDRVLDCRSYSWLSAQHMSLGAPLIAGGTTFMAKRFSQSRYFYWLKEFKINIGFVVPTMVNMLLNRTQNTNIGKLPELRFLTSSSAPLHEEQWREFEKIFGITLAQSCGSSEGGNTAAHRGADRKIGSIGPQLKYQDVRIVDGDGNLLKESKTGEIIVGGGKQQAFGYLLPNGKIELLPEGGHKTGDLGYVDSEGHLHIVGRAKELIIRGGINIAPLEIDAVLVLHQAVSEAGTLGIPDKIYGEEIIAYVSCKKGSKVNPKDLMEHCLKILPAAKCPKKIIFLNELPKNSRGKLDRNALAEFWIKDKYSL